MLGNVEGWYEEVHAIIRNKLEISDDFIANLIIKWPNIMHFKFPHNIKVY